MQFKDFHKIAFSCEWPSKWSLGGKEMEEKLKNLNKF